MVFVELRRFKVQGLRLFFLNFVEDLKLLDVCVCVLVCIVF